MNRLATGLIALVITALPAVAPSPVLAKDPPAPPMPNPACEEAVTVFHDISVIGRKSRAAENMSERHAEMAQQGWRLLGVDTYTENGDLQGFFISYVRKAPCGGTG